ncbi:MULTISPECIES: hypothetical protein [Actinomadura]|uniref:Uncharacterized protein n=1 Tax=Actinomadura litoris TaxID=2678616 RepID=A0A7K1L865_9ACTN|nr:MULTISPECIES: hypothetical protein [Actinomadura]MBT2210375.1 hypothetical protein [Actinomadura sp. NEAU-AAG7]MUN40634.1 hypothetical protein [Actinomadura litoris]
MKRVITAAVIAIAATGVGAGAAGAAQTSQPSRPTQPSQQRQDCRTYSSTTVCGKVQLDQKQQACATSMVQQGMTQRRAEVECHAFG